MVFDSRSQAGILLGEELKRRGISPDIVFGLARGGVVVAAEVARILESPLETLIVRKVGAPGNPEFAVGAVAEIPKWEVSQTSQTLRPDIVVWWNKEILRRWRLDKEWQKQQIDDKKIEISEYIRKIGITKNIRPPKSGNIVLVDDGAATGISMMAALKGIQKSVKKDLTFPYGKVRSYQIIVGLPVASTEAADMLRQVADQVVILHKDPYLGTVGIYYRQFEQVSWEKVKKLLECVDSDTNLQMTYE
ncbi:hypothetical protein HYU89_04745 [Candidatus Collierbacteria bacterium]|nr:hypothetical protein [Candidatus Collierbacteria bacterium]